VLGRFGADRREGGLRAVAGREAQEGAGGTPAVKKSDGFGDLDVRPQRSDVPGAADGHPTSDIRHQPLNGYKKSFAILALLTLAAVPQEVRVVIVRTARVYTVAGEPVERGIIRIENGRIAEVGTVMDIPPGSTV